jgi:hypothetical protein
MSRHYSPNLGEETIKGMTDKTGAGIYPSYAPVGCRNVDGTNDKRTIVPDPDTAPTITDIFEHFTAGAHSVRSLVREMNLEGVQLRGRRLQSSVVQQILRKRLYMGDFDWDGTPYPGTHEPLVGELKNEGKPPPERADGSRISPNPAQICLCLFAAVLNRRQRVRFQIEQLRQLVRIAWIILIVALRDVRHFARVGNKYLVAHTALTIRLPTATVRRLPKPPDYGECS